MIIRFLVVVFFISYSSQVNGQKVSFPTGVIYHNSNKIEEDSVITKEVVISGLIVQVKQNPKDKNIYFINFDNKFPNNSMALIVYKDTYKGTIENLKTLENKVVFVTGKVELDEKYRIKDIPLKPSIRLISPEQIKIVSDFK